MSNSTTLSELVSAEELDCQWEHHFGRLIQEWSIREQVSTALKEASAAFAAQITQPDGYKYMEACDRLAKFLDLKVSMEQSEQKLLVQVLQIACAMHENAINSPALTKTQRSNYHLTSMTLHQLTQNALDGSITHTDLWCEVFSLNSRAETAVAKATEALDLAKYLDLGKMKEDCFGRTSTTPPPEVAIPKPAVHDIKDALPTPRSTILQDKTLAMLNDQSPKVQSLGRAHTMPNLSPSPSPSRSPSSSRASRTGRKPSKPYSRGGLQALQEAEE